MIQVDVRPGGASAVIPPRIDSLVGDAQKPLRVLIVEDNIINQTVLQRQLTKTGWTSSGKSCKPLIYGLDRYMLIDAVANNGLEAIELLLAGVSAGPSGAYDAVLMDLEMPGRSQKIV